LRVNYDEPKRQYGEKPDYTKIQGNSTCDAAGSPLPAAAIRNSVKLCTADHEDRLIRTISMI
jgi:hypothetical protein